MSKTLVAWKESYDGWENPGNGRNEAMIRKTLILNEPADINVDNSHLKVLE